MTARTVRVPWPLHSVLSYIATIVGVCRAALTLLVTKSVYYIVDLTSLQTLIALSMGGLGFRV